MLLSRGQKTRNDNDKVVTRLKRLWRAASSVLWRIAERHFEKHKRFARWNDRRVRQVEARGPGQGHVVAQIKEQESVDRALRRHDIGIEGKRLQDVRQLLGPLVVSAHRYPHG